MWIGDVEKPTNGDTKTAKHRISRVGLLSSTIYLVQQNIKYSQQKAVGITGG